MHNWEEKVHLYGLEGVGGVVLSDETNDESTPQTSANAEEHVPVLDHTILLLSKDSCELLGKSAQTDGQHSLHQHTDTISVVLRQRFEQSMQADRARRLQ